MFKEKLKSFTCETPFSPITFFTLMTVFLFPVAKAPRNIAAVTLLILVVIEIVSKAQHYAIWSFDLLILLLLFFMPVLWFFHPGPGPYGAYATGAHYAIDMLLLLYVLKRYPSLIVTTIYAMVAGTTVTAALSILQYLGVLPMRHGVPIGLLSVTLTGAFSLLLVCSAGICSYLLLQAQGMKSRLLLLGVMLLLLADLLLVVPGRTGYLALIFLGGYLLYNLGKWNKLLTIGVALFTICIGISSSQIANRMQAAKDDIALYAVGSGGATSIGARFEMWKVSWGLFVQHPTFGGGTNGFKRAWDNDGLLRTGLSFDDPHSTYFYLLANYGLVGVGVLLLVIWRLALFSWLHRSDVSGATVFCFLVVFLAGSLTNTMVISSFYLSWLATIGGIMVATSYDAQLSNSKII